MNEMQRRVAATMATEARYRDRPFDWRKQATCIHLLRFHAAQMGHKLPVVPKFRSALGAKRALLSTGFQTLPALLDSRFQRVPPAFMRVGDVLAMPGDDGWDALVIKADKTKFLGWTEHATGCEFMEVDMSAAVGAWRV
jgi:hypothetical protein